MIQAIFNTIFTVKRRADVGSASRDSLNNPVYGAPTASWTTVYTGMPGRLALNAKPLQFAATAERITPNGVVYIPAGYTIYHEDRILTADTNPIEYVVISVAVGYVQNNVIDHYELEIALP